jgi:hypothetical protein
MKLYVGVDVSKSKLDVSLNGKISLLKIIPTAYKN